MSAGEFRSAFVRRFDRIWAQARQVQLSQAVCWAILTVLAGLSLLAVADYWLELSWGVRTLAVIGIALGAASVAATLFVRSFRRWRRQATAATIEHVFPQLGQRIRTTVECAQKSNAELKQAGLVPSLVAALDADTVRAAQPLPLDAVVPWRSLALGADRPPVPDHHRAVARGRRQEAEVATERQAGDRAGAGVQHQHVLPARHVKKLHNVLAFAPGSEQAVRAERAGPRANRVLPQADEVGAGGDVP